MASKIQFSILVLLICVSCLYADDSESTTAKPDASTAAPSSGSTKSPTDVDIQGMVDNLAQIFNLNNGPNWWQSASNWFTNRPGFGKKK